MERYCYRKIAPVFLNKGGRHIGDIISIGYADRLAYMSWRANKPDQERKFHYFIKYHGFGLDRATLKDLLTKWKISWVFIKWDGVRGIKFLKSNVDDWIMHGKDYSTTKEVGDSIESYGEQKILHQKYFEEVMMTEERNN